MKKFKKKERGKTFIGWNSISWWELHGTLNHTDFLAAKWGRKKWGKEHMQDINKNYTLQEDLAREKRTHSNKYFCISQKVFWKYNISRQVAQEKDGNSQRRYFTTTRYENCEKNLNMTELQVTTRKMTK